MTSESKRRLREQAEEAHVARMMEVREHASRITRGMTREAVEQLFTRVDGGMSSETTRYYEEPDVKIEILFDDTGGFHAPTNRVIGDPRIYRDRPVTA